MQRSLGTEMPVFVEYIQNRFPFEEGHEFVSIYNRSEDSYTCRGWRLEYADLSTGRILYTHFFRELDAVWQPLDWLTLNASYTYLDTEYDEYTQVSGGPAPIADAGNCTEVGPDASGDFDCNLDLSDNELEFAPENSFIFGTQIRDTLADTGFDWFVESDVVYQDERWTSAFNTVKLDDYTVVDFRVGVANETWEALVYVDNAFDDDALQSSFANTFNEGIRGVGVPGFGTPPFTFVLPLNQTPILPDERQWGVRVNYRFRGE